MYHLHPPVADLGFLNGGKGQRYEDRGTACAEGAWGGAAPPQNFFFTILGLETAYYRAF